MTYAARIQTILEQLAAVSVDLPPGAAAQGPISQACADLRRAVALAKQEGR